MEKQEITSVLQELHRITGFRVSLHGADYSEIAAYPMEKSEFCRIVHCIPGEYGECVACDREASRIALQNQDTHIYKCRYGMVEAVSPLYNFGVLTGFLMMGQVVEKDKDVSSVGRLRSLCPSVEELERAISRIRRVDGDMVDSFVKIMTICAQYLTLSNAIPGERVTVGGLAKKYLHDHYTEKVGLADVCAEIGCSRSTLITAFKREFGITVNEYLNELRMKEAVLMLKRGVASIAEIASATGFSDQSYFSKVFSARFGVPPSEYLG